MPTWLAIGVAVTLVVASISGFVVAPRLPLARRYEVYATAMVNALAAGAAVMSAMQLGRSRWDPWLIGLYLAVLVAALWLFRRARHMRTGDVERASNLDQ